MRLSTIAIVNRSGQDLTDVEVALTNPVEQHKFARIANNGREPMSETLPISLSAKCE